MITRTSLLSISAILLLACGGEDMGDGTGNPPAPPWTNKTPQLIMASPGSLAVGEKLSIYGEDFIPPTKGYQVVILNGNFVDNGTDPEKVNAQSVNQQYKASYVNGRTLTWSMYPNVVFDKTGNHLGSFVGNLQVVNVGYDGSQKGSERLPIKINVKPSLVVRLAKPTSTTCSPIIEKTIEDTGFNFAVEAVGLAAAGESSPITFTWVFTAEQWDVSWTYGMGTDFSNMLPKTGPLAVEQVVTSGATSLITDDSSHGNLYKVLSDNNPLGQARLKVLKSAKVDTNGQSMVANIVVAARDAKGNTATVTIPMEIAKMAKMTYDDSVKIAERYQPVMVSDCIPGGDIGRSVTYAEDKSETRSRGMSAQYNVNLGANFAPIPSNPFALGINFSAGFGVDINAQVSTTQSKSLNLSGQILPGEYGTFYRQTTRVHRTGKIVIRDRCGQEVVAGDAVLTDWLWTPDLATGNTCPPKTKLAPAGKFL